jgi:hypothetical protein
MDSIRRHLVEMPAEMFALPGAIICPDGHQGVHTHIAVNMPALDFRHAWREVPLVPVGILPMEMIAWYN